MIQLSPVESRAILEADRAQKLVMELRQRMHQDIDQLKNKFTSLQNQIHAEEKSLRNMVEAGNKSYQETLACIVSNAGIKSPWTAKILYDELNKECPVGIEIIVPGQTPTLAASDKVE